MDSPVHVQLSLDDADPDTALSLRRWLAAEPAVRRHAELSGGPPAPGDLGGAVDLIGVVLGTGLSVAQLVFAIAQWRQSRQDAPAVTVSRTGPDGVTVRIESSDPEAVARAVRALEAG